MATQKAQVIAYCKVNGSITAREAFVHLGINSPRKVLSDIRNSPKYNVTTIEESKVDEFGKTKRWNRYFIKEVQNNEQNRNC